MSNVAPIKPNQPTAYELQDRAAVVRDRIGRIIDNVDGMSQAKIVKQVSFSTSVMSGFLKGTYGVGGHGGNLENVLIELEKWLADYDTRVAEETPTVPDWQPTPTARRILTLIRYAQQTRDIVTAYGAAGAGKTATAEHFCESTTNAFIATITPSTGGLRDALVEVALAVGIQMKYMPRSKANIHRMICSELGGGNEVIILDDAQNLSVQAFDELRCIHDKTGVALVFLGNEEVYTRIAGNGGKRAAYLDRLFSRVGKKMHVKACTNDDADVLAEAWGVHDKAATKLLRHIATKPGGLRQLTKTMKLAATHALAAGRSLNKDDIQMAWRELGGGRSS